MSALVEAFYSHVTGCVYCQRMLVEHDMKYPHCGNSRCDRIAFCEVGSKLREDAEEAQEKEARRDE